MSSSPADVEVDERVALTHRIDNLNIFLYTFLLILTSITIWMFKHRRLRFIHETGLAVVYGLIVGCIIRYASEDSQLNKLVVRPVGKYNHSLPPDTLYLHFSKKSRGAAALELNKTYAYAFNGEVVDAESNPIERKATFDPEVFFNILLPPIIFNAGYSLKRKYFFRNLGAIFTYAFIGTTISAFVTGSVIFLLLLLVKHLQVIFSYQECLFFGALISATDPVTVLAIFHDLHVDVILYALVFGESVLNDAVAIVMTGAIEHYGRGAAGGETFQPEAFFMALGNFAWIFGMSLLIGSVMGCLTAILTKFTHVRDFPLLETCLFVLMSYSTFLMAEATNLTGIVAVLFCGICQAHYTYNNLSAESKVRTKQFFELLNLLAENFIFSYIGVSLFTFPKHIWDPSFICISFLAIAIGRWVNIYPLSFLLNLGRSNKIPLKFQHMLYCAGLRGAIAFALAIRNTVSEARRMILTTTSLIVIVTVIVCGGATTQLLSVLDIPVGVDEEQEMAEINSLGASVYNTMDETPEQSPPTRFRDKACLARVWGSFDKKYMKPFLTHSQPTLLETLPVMCTPLARCLTSTQQLTHDTHGDTADLCIDDTELSYGESHRHDQLATITVDSNPALQSK